MATIDTWLHALEAHHLADLEFSEVSRALRALSSTYVERRERLQTQGAFDSRGKRAAYALYYAPLHFLTVRHLVHELDLAAPMTGDLVDLGCGTGAASAAWASAVAPAPSIVAIDAHPWAVSEAGRTYRALGLDARVKRGDVTRAPLPRRTAAVMCGWMVNELSDSARAHVRDALVRALSGGTRVLVVEPISTRVSPWWREWEMALGAAGAQSREWRFSVQLPDLVARLGHPAGLRHDAITARSLSSQSGK